MSCKQVSTETKLVPGYATSASKNKYYGFFLNFAFKEREKNNQIKIQSKQ